ncbi:unnamed protein product [Calicophoron daubneyi]|uniref:RRM domain-containing protein n=1 Tax=Calicophoron daubneyi TaxID=300641 RepID=A0AAV2TSI2_CALDB
MTTAEPATTANSGIESHKPSFDWTDEASLLNEIQRRASDVSSRTLYISPIPANCTMEILRRLSPTAVSCRLSYNPKTKTCRRYAFLEYADSESAVAAKKTLSGRLFAGANLCVQPGRSQIPTGTGALERVDRKHLFICGLHQSVTKADLHQAFPKAEIDYPFNSDGFPLGYASAKFVNEEVALEAFKNVHGRRIRGCLVSVNFTMKSAKPVEKTPSNSRSSPKTVEHTTSSVSKEVDSSKTTSVSIIPPASPTHPATDTQLNASALPGTKPKVIIQQIVEPDSDDDNVDASKRIFLQKDSTEPLLRPTDADKPAVHPTSIISQLIRSTKRRKVPLLTNTKNPDDEESTDNSEDTKDELSTSKSEKSDASSEEPEIANSDDEDADSASVEESASGSEENTEGDSDDQINESGDEESKREDECTSGGLQSHLESALFSCPPTAEEKAKLPLTYRSSDEEVDNTLMAVMRARKGAARALKTAGSKRKWRGDGNAQLQRSGAKKFIKPYELPVPTKKNKKTLIG